MEWGRLNFQVGWFTILSIVRSSDHGIQHDFWFANGFQGHPKAPQRFFFRLRLIKDQTIGLLKSDLDLWKLFDELGIEVFLG